MTIADRFAAWWSAWQWVAILGLLLLASMALNLHLYVSKKVELATAPLKAEVAAKDKALDDSAALVDSSSKAAQELANAARRAAANLNESSNDYRAAARAAPLPIQCAPGQARQDAVNRALGAQPEK